MSALNHRSINLTLHYMMLTPCTQNVLLHHLSFSNSSLDWFMEEILFPPKNVSLHAKKRVQSLFFLLNTFFTLTGGSFETQSFCGTEDRQAPRRYTLRILIDFPHEKLLLFIRIFHEPCRRKKEISRTFFKLSTYFSFRYFISLSLDPSCSAIHCWIKVKCWWMCQKSLQSVFLAFASRPHNK